jgi:hypothetical protein
MALVLARDRGSNKNASRPVDVPEIAISHHRLVGEEQKRATALLPHLAELTSPTRGGRCRTVD